MLKLRLGLLKLRIFFCHGFLFYFMFMIIRKIFICNLIFTVIIVSIVVVVLVFRTDDYVLQLVGLASHLFRFSGQLLLLSNEPFFSEHAPVVSRVVERVASASETQCRCCFFGRDVRDEVWRWRHQKRAVLLFQLPFFLLVRSEAAARGRSRVMFPFPLERCCMRRTE